MNDSAQSILLLGDKGQLGSQLQSLFNSAVFNSAEIKGAALIKGSDHQFDIADQNDRRKKAK